MIAFHVIFFLVASGFVLSVNLGIDTINNARLRRPGGYPIVPDYIGLPFDADIDTSVGPGFPADVSNAVTNIKTLDLSDVTMVGVADSTRATHAVYSALRFDDWVVNSGDSKPSMARMFNVQQQLEGGMTAFDFHVHDFYDGYHLLDTSLPFDSSVDAYVTLESVFYVIGRYASVHSGATPIIIRVSFDADPYREGICANSDAVKVFHQLVINMFDKSGVLIKPRDVLQFVDYSDMRAYAETHGLGSVGELTGKVLVFLSQPLQDYDDVSCSNAYMQHVEDPADAAVFFMADAVTSDPTVTGVFLGHVDDNIGTDDDDDILAVGRLPLFGYISKDSLEGKTTSVGIYFTNYFDADICSKTNWIAGCMSGKWAHIATSSTTTVATTTTTTATPTTTAAP